MESYSVFLPSYSIGGNEVYKKVPEICAPYGTKAVVIGGKRAMAAAKESLEAGVAGSAIQIVDYILYGDDVTFEAAEALTLNPVVQGADMIFAVGGGRATDTCKVASDKLGKPLFTFPTICSNCAAVTLVCVMHKPDHSFGGYHFRKAPAVHCFINLDIIANAPEKYLWAGIGDALSKQYENTFSARGEELDHSNTMGIDLARSAAAPLYKYGLAAMEAVRTHTVNEALKEIALNVIITDGIISLLIETKRYNGAVGHAVFYGSTVVEECNKNHLHGEIVAFGTFVQAFVDDKPEDQDQIYKFNTAMGLPTTFKAIGLDYDDPAFPAFMDAVMADSDLDVTPYPVTREMMIAGLHAADAYTAAHQK